MGDTEDNSTQVTQHDVKTIEKLDVSAVEGFLSKKHTIPTIWGIVGSLVTLFITLVTQHYLAKGAPPTEIRVVNAPELNKSPPVVITATAELDAESRAQLKAMAQSVERVVAQNDREYKSTRAAEIAELRDLKAKLDSLSKPPESIPAASITSASGMGSTAVSHANVTGSLTTSPTIRAVTLISPMIPADKLPTFERPTKSKGYSPSEKPIYLKGLKCPGETSLSKRSTIEFNFTAGDDAQLKGISPLYITFYRVKTAHELTEEFSTYVPIVEGSNAIKLETNLEPDKYGLTVGYYRLDKLSGEYPVLYSISCKFDVVSS